MDKVQIGGAYMSKHFDYEDDHDWDDDYDYAGNNMVYWYGKYYPKEDIDALFKDSHNSDTEDDDNTISKLLATAGILIGAGYGIYKGSKFVADLIKYRRDGFDKDGYDKEGYDRNGYNKKGFNREGYDKNGFNYKGFNRDGFDKNGYDVHGRDIDGYNRFGYDERGYNRKGLDNKGYDVNGLDCCRKKHTDYQAKLDELKKKRDEIEALEIKEDFLSVMHCAKKIMTVGIKMLISHELGEEGASGNLFENLKRCEDSKIINSKQINELHWLRMECNKVIYENKSIESNKRVKETIDAFLILLENSF